MPKKFSYSFKSPYWKAAQDNCYYYIKYNLLNLADIEERFGYIIQLQHFDVLLETCLKLNHLLGTLNTANDHRGWDCLRSLIQYYEDYLKSGSDEILYEIDYSAINDKLGNPVSIDLYEEDLIYRKVLKFILNDENLEKYLRIIKQETKLNRRVVNSLQKK